MQTRYPLSRRDAFPAVVLFVNGISARADLARFLGGETRCRIPENSANVSGLIFTSRWSITSRSSPANTATCIHFHGAPRNEPRAFSRLVQLLSSPLLSSPPRKWRKRQAVKFSPASPYRRRPIFRVYSRGDVVPAIHQLETRACATMFMYKSRVATFRVETSIGADGGGWDETRHEGSAKILKEIFLG